MAVKTSHILGMNCRYRYTSLNPSSAKQYGFSKLRTKQLLIDNNIPTSSVYHIFSKKSDVDEIDWENIPTPFVIKPASGSAGKGIMIIEKKIDRKMLWLTNSKEKVSDEDLSLHVSNILDGEFSTWGSNYKAIVEEKISPHPVLARYSYQGTPDIRVIVFNSIPVMAMARIPTKESKGTANLDRGALGLGIDLGTGITTYGIKGKGEPISHFPGKKKKVNGLVIPNWTQVLTIAVRAARAAGYVFMGADLFIHPEKGPMIVELNGFPGLSIQLANRAGLKRRIERVEGLEVRNEAHGVKIAQALFAESFADKIKANQGLTIISTYNNIAVFDDHNKKHMVSALVNTGRYRSAIGSNFAEELGLLDLEDLLWRQQETNEGRVPVVNVSFKLKGRKVKTAMAVIKRLNRKKHKVEIGRRDLGGFLIGEVEE